MNRIYTLLMLLTLTAFNNSFGQTTYAINTNTTISANYTNSIFNIASGVTLTIGSTGTYTSCTFNGGNIVMVNNTITCQPCVFNGNTITMNNAAINPNSGLTTFTNVTLTANGTSSITANTPATITNSVFTFNGTGFFNNNNGQLDIINSRLNFYGNSYFIANAGPVNLKSASKLVAGNGLLASQAYIKMNGAVLNIYDAASSIVLANSNNYYFNWNVYNSISNSTSYTTTYPSAASTMNCGTPGKNACGMWSTPSVYGPSGLTSSGAMQMTATLPVVLGSFTASASSSNVALAWTTQREINSAYFAIERSANGSVWEKIGTVTAKGNTSVATRYTYTDADPLNGVAYYRLNMVDADGQQKYSDVKMVKASLINGISVYPNPATDKVNVSLTGSTSELTIKLMTAAGQVLQERKAASNTTMVTLNVQQYPRGMYILTASAADGTEQTTRLMIAR